VFFLVSEGREGSAPWGPRGAPPRARGGGGGHPRLVVGVCACYSVLTTVVHTGRRGGFTFDERGENLNAFPESRLVSENGGLMRRQS